MRFVFVGAGQRTVFAVQTLVRGGHEVVVIERDRELIESLSDDVDCSFLHGDGSKPQILQEAGPGETDALFCVTDDDRVNVLSALIGRSLGIRKVVAAIRDPGLESLCQELGLEDAVVPDRTIGRYFADMARGIDVLELSTLVRAEARFFAFRARSEDAVPVSDLDLPERARVIFFHRDDVFHLVDPDTELQQDDEVVVLAHSECLPELRERWRQRDHQKPAGMNAGAGAGAGESAESAESGASGKAGGAGGAGAAGDP